MTAVDAGHPSLNLILFICQVPAMWQELFEVLGNRMSKTDPSLRSGKDEGADGPPGLLRTGILLPLGPLISHLGLHPYVSHFETVSFFWLLGLPPGTVGVSFGLLCLCIQEVAFHVLVRCAPLS